MRAQTAKTTLTAYFSAVEEELTKPLSENELGADIIGSVYPVQQNSHTKNFQHSTHGIIPRKNGHVEKIPTKLTLLPVFTQPILIPGKDSTFECR